MFLLQLLTWKVRFLYNQSWLVCWHENNPLCKTNSRNCFITVTVTSFQVFKTIFILNGREKLVTFWAYEFEFVTSSLKSWSTTNKLKKSNRLSSAEALIFITLFSLKWNISKTGSALDQLLFELPLLSSPSLELSSARLLLSIVSESWFTVFSSSAPYEYHLEDYSYLI